LNSGATFSPDRMYRYRLWRIWDDKLPILVLLMLNPSKAAEGENESDPTVTRQIERARLLDCGGLIVVNAFAFVATDPRDMKRAADPVGPENDLYLLGAATDALLSGGKVIVAWGKDGRYRSRSDDICRFMEKRGVPLWALRVNEDGSPGHPLYIPYATEPFLWKAATA
jgi:hypothetical protein